MKKTHALFMRSIVKQFFHTVLVSRRRIGRCEIINLWLLSQSILSRHVTPHCISYTLVTLYVSLSHHTLVTLYVSHQDEKYYVTSTTPPPPPKSAGLSLTANLFIVTPPPLGSNVHMYIFLRASLVEGNNFRLPFWVNSSPHVTCKPKLRIIQIRNAKHEKVTKPRIEGKKQSSSK